MDLCCRPWDHSYASDLVIRICGACPDLTKTMWNNLKPFLEPRWTQKWLNAMQFANNLIRELKPSCIAHCVNEINVIQVSMYTPYCKTYEQQMK